MNRKDWKLICFIAALFLVFGHDAPEPRLPDFVPSTSVEIQITGGQVSNVKVGEYSLNSHPWNTR
jgi:hypothetical protein